MEWVMRREVVKWVMRREAVEWVMRRDPAASCHRRRCRARGRICRRLEKTLPLR